MTTNERCQGCTRLLQDKSVSHPLTDCMGSDGADWGDTARYLCPKCLEKTEKMTAVSQFIAFAKRWGGMALLLLCLVRPATAAELADVRHTFDDGESCEFVGNNVTSVAIDNNGPGAIRLRVTKYGRDRPVFTTLVGAGQSFTRSAGLGGFPYCDYVVYTSARGETTARICVETD